MALLAVCQEPATLPPYMLRIQYGVMQLMTCVSVLVTVNVAYYLLRLLVSLGWFVRPWVGACRASPPSESIRGLWLFGCSVMLIHDLVRVGKPAVSSAL